LTRFQTKWIVENGFGGVMFWALDLDDFNGRCGSGRFPLLRAVNEQLGIHVELPSTGATPSPAHKAADLVPAAGLQQQQHGNGLVERPGPVVVLRPPTDVRSPGKTLTDKSVQSSRHIKMSQSAAQLPASAALPPASQRQPPSQSHAAAKFNTVAPSLTAALRPKTTYLSESRQQAASEF
jgi:hypothetical protein